MARKIDTSRIYKIISSLVILFSLSLFAVSGYHEYRYQSEKNSSKKAFEACVKVESQKKTYTSTFEPEGYLPKSAVPISDRFDTETTGFVVDGNPRTFKVTSDTGRAIYVKSKNGLTEEELNRIFLIPSNELQTVSLEDAEKHCSKEQNENDSYKSNREMATFFLIVAILTLAIFFGGKALLNYIAPEVKTKKD